MSGEEMAMSDFELQKAYAAKWDELQRNAKYRQEAVQPMVDELKLLNETLQDIRSWFPTIRDRLDATNDLLAELIRRTGR